MRVLVASWTAPYLFRYGGMSTFTEGVVEAMLDKGYEVIVLSMSPIGLDGCTRIEGRPGLSVCNIPVLDLSQKGIDAAQPALLSSLKYLVNGVDYVLLNDYHFALGAMIAYRMGVPTILYVHSFAASPHELAGILYSDAVLTNSRMQLEKAVKPVAGLTRLFSGWSGRAEPRLGVVYPAPPCRKPVSLTRPQIPGNSAAKIGVLARNQENKNVEGFVKAVEILVSRGIGVTGLVAGHGWRRGWLSRHVYSLGELGEDEKWGYLASLDLYVHPATYEPFGLAPLEAVCAGTPAIVSGRSGVSEVLPGIVFEPESPERIADAIEEALAARSELLEKQRSSNIMKRTWARVLEEIEGYV